MKQFLLGTATTLFFGAVLFGAFKFFSNIHRLENSSYATVDECVLDKARGQAKALYPTIFRYCRKIVREENLDFSAFGDPVEATTPKEMTDEEAWGKPPYSNTPKALR